MRSHDRRRPRSSARAVAARRLAGIAARRPSTARPSRRSTCGTSCTKRRCHRAAARSYFSGLTIYKEERQLERLRQRHELELGRRRQGFGDVSAVESPAEAHVRRALSGEERMFAEGSLIYEPNAICVHEVGARLTLSRGRARRQAAGRTLGAPASLRLIGQPGLPPEQPSDDGERTTRCPVRSSSHGAAQEPC